MGYVGGVLEGAWKECTEVLKFSFDGYNKFVCLWPDRLWEDMNNAGEPCK